MVKPADKGGNVVIMDVDNYEVMCRDILNNREWYQPISKNIVDNFTEEYYSIIFRAYQQGLIDKNTWNYLNTKEPNIPTFYELPKVYKSLIKTSGRPIVSGCQSLTENASSLVDKYLCPHVTSLFSYIEDTIDLLQILEGMHVPKNTWLVAIDIKSIYNAILPPRRIEIIKIQLKERGPVAD